MNDVVRMAEEVTEGSQLLPCPFCGDRDIRAHHRGHPSSGEWVVECHSCSCELTGFPTEHQARERWNKRPSCEAAAPDLLAALKSTLDKWVELVTSGDAGNWDPETEPHVITARAVIAKAEGRS